MSVLAMLYMALTPCLAKSYSEKGRYYAWMIIVIGLIIPFRPRWASAIFTVDVGTADASSDFVNTAMQTWSGSITTIPTFVADANTTPIAATFNITLWHGITAAWLIGMAAFVAYQFIRHYRFVKTARRWRESVTDEQTLSVFHELKMEMGIKRHIGLHISPCAGSPMMIGFIKPQILLPTNELAEDELRFILKHELVHYKRNDLLYKSLVLIATAIHWFNPAVYLMARVVNILCETSCDAEVVRNANQDTRLEYSETIIGVVKYRSKAKLSTAFSTNFYGGKKGMKNRISSIMDMSKKRAGAFILCSVLMLTLGTGAVVTANANSPASREIIAPHSAVTESSAIIRNSNERDTTLIEAIAIARAYLGLPVIGGASFYASMNDGIRHFWVNNPNSETGFSEFWIDVTTGEILEFISASTPTPVSANAQEVATNNTTVFEASITIDTNAPTL